MKALLMMHSIFVCPNPDRDSGCDQRRSGWSVALCACTPVWLTFLYLGLGLFLAGDMCAQAQGASSMKVGVPTVDANGVQYYPVTSVYQGSQPQSVRVLKPTNPVSGQPPRLLYVLPVDAGVDTPSSTWGDALDQLRQLNVANQYNMTLIEPSFNYEPWYGDNVLDPTRRMESFLIDDLVPWGDAFLPPNSVPQRYLLGFSKSGNGVLFLILRHPGVFNAAAAWDAPTQLSNLFDFSALPLNFGTQANYNLYNIPSLVTSNTQPFLAQNRLWISGDQASWTAEMDQLNDQMTAAGIPHTWVSGATRVHSWTSGWLQGAVSGLAADATSTAPANGNVPPARTGGLPSGGVTAGTTQATLSMRTDTNATCRYATAPGVAYSSMTSTFSTTGGTAHSTLVTGLQTGSPYNYYVRCQDASGNTDANDYVISFTVEIASGPGSTATSSFTGAENPLSENGIWNTPGSWGALQKSNGALTTNSASAARMASPVVSADQFAEITYDQDPEANSWPGVMTRIQGPGNGGGYLAIVNAEQVQLYRTDDAAVLNFTLLASVNADVGAAPRDLRLESQGANHRVYLNGVLMLTYTDTNLTYMTGQPGIANAVFGGPTVRILSFAGGALSGVADTLPPVRTAGLPAGVLSSGITQTTISLQTDEDATCRYATMAGVTFAAMANNFSSTGGTTHSTVVRGLQSGKNYSFFVRCQDSAGNANFDDYLITFWVGAGNMASSSFAGTENPLSESGTWDTPGSWSSLQKNNGVFTTSATAAARLVTPAVSADQYAEITYDQDPGPDSWPGVMTRIQGHGNGSGYLAIANAGQVALYRTDDTGTLQFTLLASANAEIGTAPRRLRLESQSGTHRVYFNGVLMLTYSESTPVYTAGQPGMAAAVFGGPTVNILSFNGGSLASGSGGPPPVLSAGSPTGSLPSGTSHTTVSMKTNENANCRYSRTAGVAYPSMTAAFSVTGGTSHSTAVTGLRNGGPYNYYIRCQDGEGNADPDDYVISFTVGGSSAGTTGAVSSSFAGVEAPLSENGMWQAPGAWTSLQKNSGAFSTNVTSAAMLMTPSLAANQYAEITYDQDPGTASWPGVMTRVQGPGNGSGYLAIAYSGMVELYRADDSGGLNFTLLASTKVDVGAAPRRLRLESQGASHRIYFNNVLALTYTENSPVYANGQPGIADAVFGGPMVKILSFTAGPLAGQ